MHTQGILVILAATASLVAATPLAKRATCPSTDDNGIQLLSQSSSGAFVVCNYQTARRCEYFFDGSFSSGSSVCPDSISAAGLGNAPASGASEGNTTCPARDNNGSTLISARVDENGNAVACQYGEARLCTYFGDGGFESGSSVCPSSI